MENRHNQIKLTAAELSYLWTAYLADSMSNCILTYFLQHVDDEDIQALATHALDLSKQHTKTIQDIFSEEEIQIPQGFTDEDVNLEAPRLFSDTFYLNYIRNMAKGGLITYGRVLQNTYRHDIRSFFSKCLTSTIELDTEATRLLLEKGLAVRHPTIPYPKKQEFIQKQSFILEGLKRREILTGTEITNLHMNIQTNHLGTSLATAFAQAAQSDQVREYVSRGKDIALKHVKVFSSYLEVNNPPLNTLSGCLKWGLCVCQSSTVLLP